MCSRKSVSAWCEPINNEDHIPLEHTYQGWKRKGRCIFTPFRYMYVDYPSTDPKVSSFHLSIWQGHRIASFHDE